MEAKFFSLRRKTEEFVSFVSLWSETIDFTSEAKRKWSEKSEAKGNERSEAKKKRKKRSEKETKEAKRKRNERSEAKNKAKICGNNYFEAKWRENNLYFRLEVKRKVRKRKVPKLNKAKRKNVSEMKRNEAKRKICEAKRSGNIFSDFLLRSETNNWKLIKQKEARKLMRNFRLNMRNGSKMKRNETKRIPFRFEVKQIWSGTGSPYQDGIGTCKNVVPVLKFCQMLLSHIKRRHLVHCLQWPVPSVPSGNFIIDRLIFCRFLHIGLAIFHS